ncbi:MAG TPA: type II toxin-antitoxin system HicB family antitoxin [Acidobacteriota bacterium]|nr:type II toxin-antitoxin system HicB family antitoxin [bacterium]HNX19935.1 type II toxin-antitoxin system HicB family antitoxin [Acidobacteriota bacterium]
MRIKVVVELNDDGGFTAFVPTLPGCLAEGETPEDAVSNVKAAIEACLSPEDDPFWAGDAGEVREVVL